VTRSAYELGVIYLFIDSVGWLTDLRACIYRIESWSGVG
jgi:hypothetical protein